MGRRKKFDPTLHAKYDRIAKDAVQAFFRYIYPGCKIVEEPCGEYGIDFIIDLRGKVYFIDVEVRPEWKGNIFPFSTIHLPERKLKFNYLGNNVAFISVNNELTRGLLFKPEEHPLVVVKNKYVHNGEQFVDIPIEECRYIPLAPWRKE